MQDETNYDEESEGYEPGTELAEIHSANGESPDLPKASFADIFKSDILEPGRLHKVKLLVPKDKRKAVGDIWFWVRGSDAMMVMKWRDMNNGVGGKAPNPNGAFEYLCRSKFAKFDDKRGPNWEDPLVKAVLRRDEYESDKEWLLKNAFGRELMQWVGPSILGALIPSIEVEEAKN